jgi:molybdate transport system substrate-binding protein
VPHFLLRAFAVLVFGIMTPGLRASDVLVFGAVSLNEALRDIATDYQKGSGDKIVLNLGASSTLARQIEEGAPADVFFSADEARMDALEKKGLIVAETRTNRLSNLLVIIVSREGGIAISSPSDLGSERIAHIALGDPTMVPAGVYAKDYLEKLKLWAAVKGKVVPTENVRGALAAVESGNVEAGIVYRTDASISRKVKAAYEVPAQEGPQIRYPVAVVKGSRNLEGARKFVEYLGSAGAARVYKKYGFIVLK